MHYLVRVIMPQQDGTFGPAVVTIPAERLMLVSTPVSLQDHMVTPKGTKITHHLTIDGHSYQLEHNDPKIDIAEVKAWNTVVEHLVTIEGERE